MALYYTMFISLYFVYLSMMLLDFIDSFFLDNHYAITTMVHSLNSLQNKLLRIKN